MKTFPMKKKSTKEKKRYQKIEFEVEKLYPEGSQFSVDVLRLQAGSNDLTQIIEYAKSKKPTSNSKRQVASCKTRISLGFQNRLLIACMCECLKVVSAMQKGDEFKKAVPFLENAGTDALAHLQQAMKGKPSSIFKNLAHGRNKAVFHYDATAFNQALGSYTSLAQGLKETKSYYFVSKTEKHYFPLPENLRDFIVFDVIQGDDLIEMEGKIGELLDQSRELLFNIQLFLTELMFAYIKYRGMDRESLLKVNYVND